jgi:hypothetical protein
MRACVGRGEIIYDRAEGTLIGQERRNILELDARDRKVRYIANQFSILRLRHALLLYWGYNARSVGGAGPNVNQR